MDKGEILHCSLCGKLYDFPRVLNCLHVFCHICIEQLVNEFNVVNCPRCSQVTALPKAGANGLMTDFVMSNMLESASSQAAPSICASCNIGDIAVARCFTCPNFLCQSCANAHKSMKIFETHEVLRLQDMKTTISADGDSDAQVMEQQQKLYHKPLFCEMHPSEHLKYFCSTCQVPICNECLLADHRQPYHVQNKISDIEVQQTHDLRASVERVSALTAGWREWSREIQTSLDELQTQREQAQEAIDGAFQSFQTALEQRRSQMREDLDALHKRQEMRLWDLSEAVDKDICRVEDGCKFVERLLSKGNGVEILSLRPTIMRQFSRLLSIRRIEQLSAGIKFHCSEQQFLPVLESVLGALCERQCNESAHSVAPTESSETLRFIDQHFYSPVSSPICSNNSVSPAPFLLPVTTAHESASPGSLLQAPATTFGRPTISLDARTPWNFGPTFGGLPLISTFDWGQVGRGVAAGLKVDQGAEPSVDVAQGLAMQPASEHAVSWYGMGGWHSPEHSVDSGRTSGAAASGASDLQWPRAPSPLTAPVRKHWPLPADALPGLSVAHSLPAHLLNTPLAPPSFATDLAAASASTLRSAHHWRRPKTVAMTVRAKFGQLGTASGHLNSPHGFCLSGTEHVVVADTNNHRVHLFTLSGQLITEFGVPGKADGQLWYPRKVAVLPWSGRIVVCDRGNERSRMQVFSASGEFIRRIPIRFIDIVAGLAVTKQGLIAVVDSVSPSVFLLRETGELERWFDCSSYMKEPSDVAIHNGQFFICDFKGHCVVVFNEDGSFERRIGAENVTNYPNGIDVSDAGDILVGDSHGNRFHVVVFGRHDSVVAEFECSSVKVSRCCGLRITVNGCVVTLAKNNHHVLVLNTLFI